MAELLLEILSEEIPARMQARAADDLKRLVCDGLKEASLDFQSSETYVTPRRLTLVVDGLPTETPDISEERRGPKTDAPEKAVQGFLGSLGLTLDDVEKRETDKGEFYFAKIEKKGQKTADLLVGLIESAMQGLPWPKSMRWADHAVRWVRPMQGIVCVFDGGVVLVTFGPIEAGNKTQAHRFLTKAIIEVKDFEDYKKALETGHVLIDPLERRAAIKGDADALAAKAGLKMIDDPALLDEVAGLVEWPVTLMGSIDDEFMEVPPEVLTTTMRKNQKYFALETADGKLAPNFIVVANKETPDGGKAIIAGNERVLRARLADAKFFWDQDRKQTLAFRTPLLEEITFHAKLGTLAEKIDRVEALAADLADVVGADKDHVRSAVSLSKADLVSGMVIEFPDLQGTMGRYYALNDGESPDVADAIAEHYSPQGPSDDCPTAPVSVTVALADKIDTLVGFWAIDEKPTGSKDPYALRRAALGVIRLVMENKIRLQLTETFHKAWNVGSYEGQEGDAVNDLLAFFGDRLKVYLKDKGLRHDLISAVFALGGDKDIVRELARIEALGTFLDSEDGANLLTAYKRAANILRIEEKNDKTSYDEAADAKVLEQKEEQELHKRLAAVIDDISQNLAAEDYAKAMTKLASLRASVDAFFDEVTVNCEDATLRVNRLRLLSQIRTTMNQVADFSQIEGGER
ncbi:MAG: glycine--tRNA ligase subunit beta [Rhodospirillaceae bacterium]|nr:glycine--tRNA ligase subunit beta [Rhodospirillaceae bacterium]